MVVGCTYCKSKDHSERECSFFKKAIVWAKSMNFKDSFSGSSPTPFVGRVGYPKINLGLMSVPEITSDEAVVYDAPKQWAKENFSIPDVVTLRSHLVNSRAEVSVKENSKFISLAQEVAMAKKPAELDIEFSKPLSLKLSFSSDNAPFGPSGVIKKIDLTSNPYVSKPVEKVVSDTDFKSVEALSYLYAKGVDENFLTRIFSVGLTGLKNNRKLVPTRWSITAVDDTIGKELLKEVKLFDAAEDPFVFFNGQLGNYYLIMVFPSNFSFELFEIHLPSGNFSADFEDFNGRTSYAENTVGGYYANRLAILEEFKKRKIQGGVLSIRFITDEYTAPLGVWCCREASRKSVSSQPVTFGENHLLLKYAMIFSKRKFGYDLSKIINQSRLRKEVLSQKKLSFYK